MKKIITKNILAAGLISVATSALAIDAADIINRMEARGYTDIETSTTLFGNTLIVGNKDGSKHEFVINKSGVVLRENLRETFKQSSWGSKIFSIFDMYKKDNKKITLYLSSAELKNNELVNRKVIFEANAYRRSPAHMGAKIAFLNDGTLLLTSGDGYDHREKAQRLDNHFGKIIRINRDGSIPQDNPFISDPNALSDIYSYGHRNMQGLVVTSSGLIFEHEHGPKGGDELNIIKPSLNYGWPAITYGIDYSGAVISPFTEKEGMEQPLFYWIPSIAPSDMIFYEKDLYPELKNNFLITALVSKDVKQINKNDLKIQKSLFSDLNSRLRNIQDSPKGYIYILTDGSNNKLIKVIPK